MTTQSLHPVQTLLRPGALAPSLNWRFDRRMLFIVAILISFAGMVGWAHLDQQSQTAALNAQIEDYRQNMNYLNNLNADVEARIAEATQLETIAEQARELGFAPPENTVYLLTPAYPVESSVSWQANPLSTR